jgi:hypothetical protein
VGAIGTSEYVTQTDSGTDAQREELDWLLTSGVLGRSGNLTRVLTYICEEHFQGRADRIKEYTIATEALGRRSDFDPQSDTIVRVTVHSLRKRLLEVYQNEGVGRPLRLVIPPGHYAPSFIHLRQPKSPHELEVVQPTESQSEKVENVSISVPARDARTLDVLSPLRGQSDSRYGPWLAVIAFVLVVVATAGWFLRHQRLNKVHLAETSLAMPIAEPVPQETIHALMGSGRESYVDHSGNTWTSENYCQGGTNVAVPSQKIEGTEDAPLYFAGVRGIAHCVFPVSGSLYEMRFSFAETTDLPAATRLANLSINAGPTIGFDVVDNAGGDGIATSVVVTNIAPENDGAIHLDFTSEISPLNAVEILPAPSAKQLPIRIVASSTAVTDDAKQLWSSDRYFSGGRHGQKPRLAPKTNLGIYGSVRIGRFRYNIPAVPFARYRVKLYFREPWFGKENGGNGAPGSRVFDVACNGAVILKDFDILAQSGTAPVVKTFENVQASAGGRIELYFMPVVNYPVVSAIEVLPED